MQSTLNFKSCDYRVHILGVSRKAYAMEVRKSIGEVYGGLYEIEIRKYQRSKMCFFGFNNLDD